ncbi:sigma-70 family RNA polymerase sigma factor [Bacillus badius]|nr:sigma-70 family RNA polymerase sigma factor [Bacillus badius]
MSLEDVWEKYHKFLYKLSHKFVKRAYRHGLELDDLMTVAKEGMIKAFERFDSKAGVKFITFLGVWVEGLIKRLIRDEGYEMKISRSVKEIITKINTQQLQDYDSKEIAEKIEYPVNDVETALEFIDMNLTHLDADVQGKDGSASSVSEIVGKKQDMSGLIVEEFLSFLPEKLRLIMQLRLEDKTQNEIGKILGVSQVQVSRLQRSISKYWDAYERGEKQVRKLEMTVDEFVKLKHIENKSYVAIGKIKGVSDVTVHKWAKKNEQAIQQALKQLRNKTESKTTKLIKQTVEPAGERKYEVLEAAVKQLENEKAAWQKRAEKAEKELSQRDDDKEALRQANIQLANDNKEYREEIDNLTKARITAESELDRVSEEYTKSAEALRMARDEGALAQKRLEQQDYELENLRHSFRSLKESMEVLTKENRHLWGLVEIYMPKVSV